MLGSLQIFERHFFVLTALLIGCSISTRSATGLFRADDGALVELHVSPDQQIRGFMRAGERIAALSSVSVDRSSVTATAIYDDGSRGEISKAVRLIAVEAPASAEVRREIEEAYRRLAQAVERKDFDAFQALRVAEFATIPPDGIPSPASRMAERARGFLERIQAPIKTTNEILELTTRGDEAIATVRQKFTRQVPGENQPHTVHTEVTQRETWRKTAEGWKLVFVDEVRDFIRLLDGQRVP
jgi:ketosteroid isomerase-like protein